MLNKNIYLLLDLIHDYIKQISSEETLNKFTETNGTEIDWKYINDISVQNNVLSFVYYQIKNFNNRYNITTNILMSLKNRIIYRSSQQIKADEYLYTIIDSFDKSDVKFIILKGVIIAKMYPQPEYRYSSDVDIHIDEKYLEKAQEILSGLGYEHRYENTEKYESAYKLNDISMIELHTRLFSDFYDKHEEILEKYEIDSIKNLTAYDISGKKVLSLRPNELLIHLLCHMTKHFVDSGIFLRHFMDITICVNTFSKQLDFDYIMTFFKKIKADKFAAYILNICEKYLGMDYTDDYMTENIVTEEFLYDILQRLSNKDNINKTSGFFAYYKNDKKVLKDRILPGSDILSDKYLYAKKHKLLLPVAWGHRGMDHVLRIVKTPGYKKSLKNSRRRMDLLKKLGLL